ncbi:MAG: AraC family transcriptional regulator [Ruminococcaceae bacterium]|nr:AraC family transcriptional regulator [Oscillospiraceae bacterium]
MANIEEAIKFEIGTDAGKCSMPSMHYHDTYELYHLDAGSREYFIEDKLFPVSMGDFVLIPPGKLHRTGGEFGARTLINFSQAFLDTVYTREATTKLLQCFDNWILTPDEEQQIFFDKLFQKMLRCKNPVENAVYLGTLLAELSKCQRKELEEDKISAIVAYINENFANIKSIDEIAAAFFISKYHLCRIFKDAMKMTVVDYLNEVKLKQACQYLKDSQRTVDEIAYLCGFHSAAYFSRLFKKHCHISPSRYRKEYSYDS